MAKNNELKINPEGQTENEAGEEKGKRETDARRRNAKKQKDFRENMKAKGYKQVTIWEKPLDIGMVKRWEGAAPAIHKGTVGICERNKYAHTAVREMQRAFFEEMEREGKKVTPEIWSIYFDINALLSPLGYNDN